MSTNVSSYNLGYDPYLAQRLNAAVSAAQAGTTAPALFPTQGQTTSTSSSSAASASTTESLAECRRKLAEIEKLQKEAENGVIIEENGQKLQVQSDGYAAEDGCNDGKISFGSKLKNFGKGILKTFTGLFTDENGKFSLGKTLKSVAIGAICVGASVLLPGVGSALCYAGLAMGGIGLIKNGRKAYNAKTDQEAEQAWQGLGTSATITAASLAGVKARGAAANKAAGVTKEAGIKGVMSDLKAGFSDMNSDLSAAKTLISEGNYTAQVKQNIAKEIFNKQSWEALKHDQHKFKSAYNNFKNKLTGGEEYLANAKKANEEEIARLEASKKGLSKADKAKVDQEIELLKNESSVYEDASLTTKTKISRKTKTLEKQLTSTNKEIETLDTQLASAPKSQQKAILKQIAGKEQEAAKIEAQIKALGVRSAKVNNQTVRMAYNNFRFNHTPKQVMATVTKTSLGLNPNSNLIMTEAIAHATSSDPTMATYSPDLILILRPLRI